MKLVVILCVSLSVVASVEVSRCCAPGYSLNLDNFSCLQTSTDSTNDTHFTPKIYSLEAEAFVDEELELSSQHSLPTCSDELILQSSVLSEESGEEFLILSGQSQLFVTSRTESYDTWCLDSGAAVFCGQDPWSQCSDHVCVSLCCPQHTVLHSDTGHCVFTPEYSLQPPLATHDNITEDDLVMIHDDLEHCNVTVYDDPGDWRVTGAGLIIGHHTVVTGQYCLEQVSHGDQLSGVIAKICTGGITGDNDERMFEIISTRLTPALLIISEVFLLLTFIIHAIVPEFRKQMFGRCHCVIRTIQEQ